MNIIINQIFMIFNQREKCVTSYTQMKLPVKSACASANSLSA